MKVLTSAEMREVDRRTIEAGIPHAILMENAGHRVVEYLEDVFRPLASHRIVIFCGPGDNGGDGLVAARQLLTRIRPAALWVVNAGSRDSDALRMFRAAGGNVHDAFGTEMQTATILVDGLLGTGASGPARGGVLDAIRIANQRFPLATTVSIDIPSGLLSDESDTAGEFVRADHTITFTAPKIAHALAPNCDRMGKLHVAQIGSPPSLCDRSQLQVNTPEQFRHLMGPRAAESNKGDFGHVLVVGGSEGKSGAAELTATAALRAGAGLVTVASSASRFAAPELMTESLPSDYAALAKLLHRKTAIAIGPGLGLAEERVQLVRDSVQHADVPAVVDADGVTALANWDWSARGRLRILTPHPGEMSRLAGIPAAEVQRNRLEAARKYAANHDVTVVLKGHRTIIAVHNGDAWVNPVDSPALATAGTGDVLTGLIAGFLAQYPGDPIAATLAAVYLHGRAGQIGAAAAGERTFIATDVFRYLPEAMRECAA